MNPRYAAAVARSIRRRIDACELDLTGLVVATECANGAYATTAAAALAAGAKAVWAFGKDSRWASVDEAADDVRALAQALGADVSRLHVVREKSAIAWRDVDLVTNSGHLRPLDRSVLGAIKDTAVIALMFEAWELRDGDIDLDVVRSRGLPIFGVDEHHPACGSFEFVGALAVSEAMRQGWSVGDARVAVISDNAFLQPVLRALAANGAEAVAVDPRAGRFTEAACDLAVLATTPPAVAVANKATPLDVGDLARLVASTGAYGCVQLWGDIDRDVPAAKDVLFAPEQTPHAGHQGVAMNAAGHEATVRLQVGGLAAALHGRRARAGATPKASPGGLVQAVDI